MKKKEIAEEKVVESGAQVLAQESKADSQGRRIVSRERWAEVLAGYPQSGLTQAQYAKREGVNYHTLVARRQRQRQESLPTAPRAGSLAATSGGAAFIKITPPTWGATLPLEVVLPAGIIVRETPVMTPSRISRARSLRNRALKFGYV